MKSKNSYRNRLTRVISKTSGGTVTQDVTYTYDINNNRIGKQITVGTALTREWKGQSHRVQVEQGGFRYQGQRFDSLSEIARAITGTRWSGPRFFGLEETRTLKAKSGAGPASPDRKAGGAADQPRSRPAQGSP